MKKYRVDAGGFVGFRPGRYADAMERLINSGEFAGPTELVHEALGQFLIWSEIDKTLMRRVDALTMLLRCSRADLLRILMDRYEADLPGVDRKK